MRERVAAAPVGRLATVSSDGRPRIVPCCFALLSGDRVVTAVDHKPKSTTELHRLADVRANGVASLLVDHYDDDWSRLWWVRMNGPAFVLEAGAAHHASAVDALVVKYPQYRADRPTGAVIAITIEEWRSWSP